MANYTGLLALQKSEVTRQTENVTVRSQMNDPFTYASNETNCYVYLSLEELFSRCEQRSAHEMLAEFGAGLAAVIVFPTAILSTIANSVLIIFLLLIVRLPRKMELWGITFAMHDIGFIFVTGVLDAGTLIGAPWWGDPRMPIQYQSQLSCKLIWTIKCYLTAFRSNLLLFVTLQTTRKLRVDDKHIIWVFRTCTLIFITAIVTLFQAIPAFMVYGLWQHHGVFSCSPDPIVPKILHTFFFVHKAMFIDGMLQCSFCVLLSAVVYRQHKRVRSVVNHLRAVHLSQDTIGVTLLAIILRLEESCQCLRIVFWILIPMLVGRLARLVFPDPSGLHEHHFHNPRQARLRRLTDLSLWHLVTYIEVIFSGFGYLCWVVNIPIVSETLLGWWRKLTFMIHTRRWWNFVRTPRQTYFKTSCDIMGVRPEELNQNRALLNKLGSLKQHLEVFYVKELEEADHLLKESVFLRDEFRTLTKE